MGRIAKMLQTKIGELIVQTVEAYFGANVTAETFAPSGDDSPPLADDRVVLVSVDGTGNFVSVGVLSKSQGAKPGERILYSRDANGNVKAAIRLLNDGTIELVSPVEVKFIAEKLAVRMDKEIAIEAGTTLQLKGQQVELTGGQLTCKGTAQADGSGCFCGMPFCAFTGAPQTGKDVFNT